MDLLSIALGFREVSVIISVQVSIVVSTVQVSIVVSTVQVSIVVSVVLGYISNYPRAARAAAILPKKH